jgi:sugar phosphate isomerase/epimerase
VREAEAALQVARRIPFDVLVVHLGTPTAKAQPGDNNRAAAFRSAEDICRLAAPLGVRVALEVIPNDLSSAASLVSMLEGDLDAPHAGICMDFGHAHLMGDVADAVEAAAEHLIATHVHDNRRREDDHLAPFLGSINWDMALMTMQKIGYDGTYLMELANTGSPAAVLEEARRARERFEKTLTLP